MSVGSVAVVDPAVLMSVQTVQGDARAVAVAVRVVAMRGAAEPVSVAVVAVGVPVVRAERRLVLAGRAPMQHANRAGPGVAPRDLARTRARIGRT